MYFIQRKIKQCLSVANSKGTEYLSTNNGEKVKNIIT